jgi:glucose/arabinose dehydrogenase
MPMHIHALLAWALLVGVLPAVPAAAQRVPTQLKTEDYSIKVEVYARGLNNPWGIAFIDERTAIVTEKAGPVRFIIDGKLQSPIEGTPKTRDFGQGGMMAVAVDPNYATEPWIYLGYNHALDESARRPTMMTRIVRGKVVENKWTEEQVLWESKPEHYRPTGVHFGCRIVFDPDGYLFFAIGERGIMQDAQDLTRPNGKSFRINRDGSIPKDNPFVGRPNVYESIFTYGNRNIQGLAVHPVTGLVWSTEHGPMGGDELNLLKPGLNYGWPVITFGRNYDGSVISNLTSKEGMEQPNLQWTPSLAVCGLAFYSGEKFTKWENHLLVGALAFQEILRLEIDGEKVTKQEVIMKGWGRVRDVQVGPDGAIYAVMNTPDLILRLTPQ